MSQTAADQDVVHQVEEVLVRYATGIDTRDWDLFRSCFTADCEADYGDIGRWRGVDEITEWMRETHAACGHTMHRITNVAVARVDGGRAQTRAYVDALVLFAGNETGVRAAGWYDDELVRTDDRWRIARRRFTSAWVETLG